MSAIDIVNAITNSRDTRVVTTVRELLEWTYAAQKAHRGGAPSVGGAGISQTGVVMEIGRLGCLVDRSAGGSAHWGQTYCDDDALAVHGAIEEMRSDVRATLIRHAEARAVPDWRPMILPLRAVSVPGRKGRTRGIYDKHGHVIGCDVTYEGDIPTRAEYAAMRWRWPDSPVLRVAEDVIEHARTVYVTWIEALEAVQDVLSWARLRRWCVCGLGAERAPWVNIP